jgi:hypothetical protein
MEKLIAKLDSADENVERNRGLDTSIISEVKSPTRGSKT